MLKLLGVPAGISRELRVPVAFSRFRKSTSSATVLMPKASMHKNERVITLQDDIGAARQKTIMQTVAKSIRV
jgi:hypothetical protein